VLDKAAGKFARKDGRLYHYLLPAPHVLLLPVVVVLVAKYQSGRISVQGDRWTQGGVGMRRFFGREGLGNHTRGRGPGGQDDGDDPGSGPNCADVPVLPVIVFTTPNLDTLDLKESRIPATHAAKLGPVLRQQTQALKPLLKADYDALRAAFDARPLTCWRRRLMPMPSDASWADVLWIDTGSVNVYLCRDSDGFTSSMPPCRARLTLSSRGWPSGAGGRPTWKRILITHADPTTPAARRTSGALRATAHAGAATAALLVEGRSPRHMPPPVQFLIDHFVRYKRSRRAIRPLSDGDELPVLGGLRVLAAPGHTLEQRAFYSPAAGVLFAADALNTRDGRLQLTPRRITADQAAAERSAIQLLQLSPGVIACGHGAPLVDGRAAMAELLAQLAGLREALYDPVHTRPARFRTERIEPIHSGDGQHG
jgi:glyoxylase-like metal-dependent hydrolase (beta-lactamase superfamily II)